MASRYEAGLRREKEVARSQEVRINRELLGEFVFIETGCTPEETDTVTAETSRKESA